MMVLSESYVLSREYPSDELMDHWNCRQQKRPKSRVETIKRTTSRNNFPVHGLLLRLLCIFAI